MLSVPEVNHSPREERRDRRFGTPSILTPRGTRPGLSEYPEDTEWLEGLPFRDLSVPLYRPGSNFRAPTLLLFGRQDAPFRCRTYWKLLDGFPRATYAILDAAGHTLWTDRNPLAAALVRDWLDRIQTYRRSPLASRPARWPTTESKRHRLVEVTVSSEPSEPIPGVPVGLPEAAVEVRSRAKAKEPHDVPVDLVDSTKCSGGKVGQFQLPKTRVSANASDSESSSRTKGLADERGPDRFERPADGHRKFEVLLVRRRAEDEAMRQGQRPWVASSRERARTAPPATSGPSIRRRSISAYHPGGT